MQKFSLFSGVAALGLVTAAHAQPIGREILPVPEKPFGGKIAEHVSDSLPDYRSQVEAPAGAPNVIVVLTDDVGFATSSVFGGPVPTPALSQLARGGVRYNRFHTVGICSPTRAALLTGRNHHQTGNGHLSGYREGFPGYRGEISRSTATLAEILKLNGYNTAMFGKHHNTLKTEVSAAGPFDQWPTGLGFEYFFGFLGGDADQYRPNIYRGTHRIPAPEGKGEMLDKRMADDAITWIHNQKAAAPGKPFFVYYAPGTLHAPHQAPRDWIERFKGQFDQGWDKLREETYKRQLASGIIPPNTQLTDRPEDIPAWDSLSPAEQKYAAGMMEVAAGTLAYQDHQIGRIFVELERMGELDNTLIIFVEGDNGASGEAGPPGTLSEMGQLANNISEDTEWFVENLDDMGGPRTYQNYPVGWAWALVSPLRWTKQYASYLGGVRNGMVVSWPDQVSPPGSVCRHFGHVVDIAPTVLAAAGLPAPRVVNGVEQKVMDGVSLLPTLRSCEGTAERTQYFEVGGKIAIYKDGWFASRDDGRIPWTTLPPEGHEPRWELYDLDSDFSQAHDLAGSRTEKLRELRAVWQKEASRNNVFPLDSRFGGARQPFAKRPDAKRDKYVYWSDDTSVSFGAAPNFAGKSFSIDASVKLDSPTSSGVILANGSHFGGWSFFLDNGIPTVVHALSTKPSDTTKIVGVEAMVAGDVQVKFEFKSEGGPGAGGTVRIIKDDRVIGEGRIPQTIVRTAGLGEYLDIGRDTGVPVAGYKRQEGRLEGRIKHVKLTFP